MLVVIISVIIRKVDEDGDVIGLKDKESRNTQIQEKIKTRKVYRDGIGFIDEQV